MAGYVLLKFLLSLLLRSRNICSAFDWNSHLSKSKLDISGPLPGVMGSVVRSSMTVSPMSRLIPSNTSMSMGPVSLRTALSNDWPVEHPGRHSMRISTPARQAANSSLDTTSLRGAIVSSFEGSMASRTCRSSKCLPAPPALPFTSALVSATNFLRSS